MNIHVNCNHADQKIIIDQNNVAKVTHVISATSQKINMVLQQGAQCMLHVRDMDHAPRHLQPSPLAMADVAGFTVSGEAISEAWIPGSSNKKSSDSLQQVEYHIFLHTKAQLDVLILLIDSYKLSVVIYVHLQGDGAQASINGIYALDSDQNVSIKTFQYHRAQHTTSDVVMKGMLKDQSQAHFQGLIFIDKQAKKTQASQENKNILLSKQAKVISVPSIEVLQHDVQCCHGSAIGKFDQEQLWYLQSRGLSQLKAYELLIQSFFQEVVQHFNDEKIMEMLCQKMI